MSAQSFMVGSMRIYPNPTGVTFRFPCDCSIQTICNPSCGGSLGLFVTPPGFVGLEEGSDGHTGCKDLVSNESDQARVGSMITRSFTAPQNLSNTNVYVPPHIRSQRV
ncbi:unnamed protein product [Brassica oleracea var. botrytis]